MYIVIFHKKKNPVIDDLYIDFAF